MEERGRGIGRELEGNGKGIGREWEGQGEWEGERGDFSHCGILQYSPGGEYTWVLLES